VLTITVDDPGGQIKVQDRAGARAGETTLALGVMSGFGYYAARLTGRAGSQWTYSVAVPVAVPVRLFVGSADESLSVADQTGNAIALRTPGPAFAAPSSSGLSVALVVK
jgi:hypothetical protein